MSVEDGFEARKYLKSLECFRFNKSELDKGLSHNFMFNAANEFIALNNRIDELHDIAIRDLARIKELEKKLNKIEWKPIALIEREGAKYPKGQKFDLWIKDFDEFPSLGPYSYILSNLTWHHEEGRWLTSSDEYLTDRVYIHATHARPVVTPATQEGDKK